MITYTLFVSNGCFGVVTQYKKFPPTNSSFSAFLLPFFHCFSSVQVKKCIQTSDLFNTGCLHTLFTQICKTFLRCSIKSSSYRPKNDMYDTEDVKKLASTKDLLKNETLIRTSVWSYWKDKNVYQRLAFPVVEAEVSWYILRTSAHKANQNAYIALKPEK